MKTRLGGGGGNVLMAICMSPFRDRSLIARGGGGLKMGKMWV